jgi:hypothetical protein
MTCGHCGATVPEDAERCPKCLRKSGVLAPEAPGPTSSTEGSTPQKRPIAAVLSLVAVIGVLVIARAFLRTAFVPPPSVHVPPSTINLDPHGLESISVRTSTSAVEGGKYIANITADAGDFERTFEKLKVHAIATTAAQVKSDPDASGEIRAFIPPRFRTPDHERRVEEEQKTIHEALVNAAVTTAKGAPVRITFTFGELPP